MGCFSWLKADTLTNIANIVEGEPFKFLIPKEFIPKGFSCGFIKDYYRGYGLLGHSTSQEAKYDMYELLAFWNQEILQAQDKVLVYDGKFHRMKIMDDHTDQNRNLGIDIGCYEGQINKLKYPLKLVSCSYTGDYESLTTRSYNDPYQGGCPLYRNTLKYKDLMPGSFFAKKD